MLAYWAVVWFKSYLRYKDIASLLVLVYIAQNLFGQIWFMTAGIYAIRGTGMSNVMFYGNYIDQGVVAMALAVIYYLVRRMQNEEEEKNDR